jgi:hypothetical protein
MMVLQPCIDDPEKWIQDIIDMGCGDWSRARFMQFGNRRSTGYDIVPQLTDYLQKTHGNARVSFPVTDGRWNDVAGGYLLPVKDILQQLGPSRTKTDG